MEKKSALVITKTEFIGWQEEVTPQANIKWDAHILLSQPYERNPAYPEELKFSTTNKVLMRTKSEFIIANRLEHYNIPYLPEMPLWFAYNLRPKYPDFTILKPNGETIIWEHMGRMDKEDYFTKNSRKIIEYRQNGYSQNTNLIITFEEDIIEPGMIDHIIETRILL